MTFLIVLFHFFWFILFWLSRWRMMNLPVELWLFLLLLALFETKWWCYLLAFPSCRALAGCTEGVLRVATITRVFFTNKSDRSVALLARLDGRLWIQSGGLSALNAARKASWNCYRNRHSLTHSWSCLLVICRWRGYTLVLSKSLLGGGILGRLAARELIQTVWQVIQVFDLIGVWTYLCKKLSEHFIVFTILEFRLI